MDKLIECPVCTLFLHAGMNLHDHLETHPKEKVIDALVSMTIKQTDTPTILTQQPTTSYPSPPQTFGNRRAFDNPNATTFYNSKEQTENQFDQHHPSQSILKNIVVQTAPPPQATPQIQPNPPSTNNDVFGNHAAIRYFNDTRKNVMIVNSCRTQFIQQTISNSQQNVQFVRNPNSTEMNCSPNTATTKTTRTTLALIPSNEIITTDEPGDNEITLNNCQIFPRYTNEKYSGPPPSYSTAVSSSIYSQPQICSITNLQSKNPDNDNDNNNSNNNINDEEEGNEIYDNDDENMDNLNNYEINENINYETNNELPIKAQYTEVDDGNFVLHENPQRIVEYAETDDGDFFVTERIIKSPPQIVEFNEESDNNTMDWNPSNVNNKNDINSLNSSITRTTRSHNKRNEPSSNCSKTEFSLTVDKNNRSSNSNLNKPNKNGLRVLSNVKVTADLISQGIKDLIFNKQKNKQEKCYSSKSTPTAFISSSSNNISTCPTTVTSPIPTSVPASSFPKSDSDLKSNSIEEESNEIIDLEIDKSDSIQKSEMGEQSVTPQSGATSVIKKATQSTINIVDQTVESNQLNLPSSSKLYDANVESFATNNKNSTSKVIFNKLPKRLVVKPIQKNSSLKQGKEETDCTTTTITTSTSSLSIPRDHIDEANINSNDKVTDLKSDNEPIDKIIPKKEEPCVEIKLGGMEVIEKAPIQIEEYNPEDYVTYEVRATKVSDNIEIVEVSEKSEPETIIKSEYKMQVDDINTEIQSSSASASATSSSICSVASDTVTDSKDICVKPSSSKIDFNLKTFLGYTPTAPGESVQHNYNNYSSSPNINQSENVSAAEEEDFQPMIIIPAENVSWLRGRYSPQYNSFDEKNSYIDLDNCSKTNSNSISIDRAPSTDSLNIRTDEKMPAKGEISEQESNGEVEWNQYYPLPPEEVSRFAISYDMSTAQESWNLSDKNNMHVAQRLNSPSGPPVVPQFNQIPEPIINFAPVLNTTDLVPDTKKNIINVPYMDIAPKDECSPTPLIGTLPGTFPGTTTTAINTIQQLQDNKLEEQKKCNLPSNRVPKSSISTPSGASKVVRIYHCLLCDLSFPKLYLRRNHLVNVHGIDPRSVKKASSSSTPSTSTSTASTSQNRDYLNKTIQSEQISQILMDYRMLKQEILDEADNNKENKIISTLNGDNNTTVAEADTEGIYGGGSSSDNRKKSKKTYVCITCNAEFSNLKSFDEHLSVHPAECLSCGRLFKHWVNFGMHIKRHLGIKNHSCRYCSKKFLMRHKLIEHIRVHTGLSPLKCADCGEQFKRHSNLSNHRSRHHFNRRPIKKDYVCQDCGEIFHSVAKLEWHRETHDNKPKGCPYCRERFIHKNSLTRHIRLSHTDKYVFVKSLTQACPICDQKYATSSLKAHIATHSTITNKNYKCAICSKNFSTKWNLKQHHWTHANRSSKPFQCTLCSNAFIRETDYVTHMNAHKSIKPYTCNHCGCQFVRKYNWLRHTREHERDKKYSCTTCGKKFHRAYYLTEHLRIHTGERPFSCNICGKTSATKTNHNKHVKIHHARDPLTAEG